MQSCHISVHWLATGILLLEAAGLLQSSFGHLVTWSLIFVYLKVTNSAVTMSQ